MSLISKARAALFHQAAPELKGVPSTVLTDLTLDVLFEMVRAGGLAASDVVFLKRTAKVFHPMMNAPSIWEQLHQRFSSTGPLPSDFQAAVNQRIENSQGGLFAMRHFKVSLELIASGEGKLLFRNNNGIVIQDIVTLERKEVAYPHQVTKVAIKNGKLFAAFKENDKVKVHVLDLNTYELIDHIELDLSDTIRQMEIVKDKVILLTDGENASAVHVIDKNPPHAIKYVLPRTTRAIGTALIAANEKYLLMVVSDGAPRNPQGWINIYDMEKGDFLRKTDICDRNIDQLMIFDGQCVAFIHNPPFGLIIKKFDLETGKTLTQHSYPITGFSEFLVHNGTLFAGIGKTSIAIFDLASMRGKGRLPIQFFESPSSLNAAQERFLSMQPLNDSLFVHYESGKLVEYNFIAPREEILRELVDTLEHNIDSISAQDELNRMEAFERFSRLPEGVKKAIYKKMPFLGFLPKVFTNIATHFSPTILADAIRAYLSEKQSEKPS